MAAFRRWPTFPAQAIDASELAVTSLRDLRLRFHDEAPSLDPVLRRAEEAARQAALAFVRVQRAQEGAVEMNAGPLASDAPSIPELRRAAWRSEYIAQTFDELASAIRETRSALEELQMSAAAADPIKQVLELLIRNARATDLKAAALEWGEITASLRRSIDAYATREATDITERVLAAPRPALTEGERLAVVERAHQSLRAALDAEKEARDADVTRGLALPQAPDPDENDE